jgi:hypothetical protein
MPRIYIIVRVVPPAGGSSEREFKSNIIHTTMVELLYALLVSTAVEIP